MVKYKLLNAQREFLEIPHNQSLDVAMYVGGYGSGKTFSGSLLGIMLCIKFPGIRGLVGAQTLTLVRDTTQVQYFEHLEEMGFIENRDYFFKKAEQKLIFKNGSEIIFRFFEKPNKLKSLNLGFVQIEEASDIPEATFKMLLGRMRQKIHPSWVNFTYRIFGHTNPEENKGWIYKNFVTTQQSNYRLIHAPTTQNIHLPAGFVENLKQLYDEEYFNIFVLGQFGDYASGLVVKGFSQNNIQEITYKPTLPLHITCDFNVDPMCWLLAHKTENKVFYFDEIVIENTHTNQTMDVFLEKYGLHQGEIIINGDASGDYRCASSEYTNFSIIKKRLTEHFGPIREIRLEIRNFNPSIKNRIASFNAKVKNASGEMSVFIDPKCKRFIQNIQNLAYKPGTSTIDLPTPSQIKADKSLKFLGHPMDAGSYLVEYYWALLVDLA